MSSRRFSFFPFFCIASVGFALSGCQLEDSSTGTSCTTDDTTGIKLCLGTTECSDYEVNSTTYPNCGYYTFAAPFDLECLCNGRYLCPVGSAAACSDVAGLFKGKTLTTICAQVSSGICTNYMTTASTSTGSSTSTSSTCDQDCRDMCADIPSCITGCGC